MSEPVTKEASEFTIKELLSALENKIKEGGDEKEVDESTRGWEDTKKE